MSDDGKHYFISHSIGRFTVPTTHLDRGWINTSAVSVFDVAARKYVNTVLLDDTVRGAANPWGLAVAGKDEWLCVNISGTHELMVVNLKEMMKRLASAANPKEVVNDLSFLYGVKTRIPLEGQGARALAVVGNNVYSAMRFADSLNLVELWDDGPGTAVALPLGTPKPLTPVRAGERAFYDATLCYQHWLSCTSCHSGTRTDGTNWDLMNDGIGNPKQTKNMIYTHLTPPTMVTGIRPDLQACNRKGLTHIQFVVRPEEDALCLDAYAMSLTPEVSPYRVNGALSAKAKQGERLFKRAGCAECHPGDKLGAHGERLFTNLKKFNLGLGVGNEEGREFDTPTLVEVWRTAPYLYDGRALTMQELLKACNPQDAHGATQKLNDEEIDALAEFVLSL